MRSSLKAIVVAILLVLSASVSAFAQPAPAIFSTLQTTGTGVTNTCIGCPIGSTTSAANSGMKVATISIEQFASPPSVCTNKLANLSGALQWNCVTLATGSTISGSTNTLGMFTGVASMGNSIISQNVGATIATVTGTMNATVGFTGSGAGLTGIPTTALTGNYVATVGSGTGITSSVTTGNAANTVISLNNTSVTPGAYPMVTVDQQGRVTSGTAAVTATTVAASGLITSPIGITTLSTGTAPLVTTGFDASNQYTMGRNNGTGYLTFDATNAGSTKGFAFIGGGDMRIGGTNLTDAVATPTEASGCGGLGSITGKVYAFRIQQGGSASTTCNVNFNTTFANIPVCVASFDNAAIGVVAASPTTTTVALFYASSSSNMINVLCRGF